MFLMAGDDCAQSWNLGFTESLSSQTRPMKARLAFRQTSIDFKIFAVADVRPKEAAVPSYPVRRAKENLPWRRWTLLAGTKYADGPEHVVAICHNLVKAGTKARKGP